MFSTLIGDIRVLLFLVALLGRPRVPIDGRLALPGRRSLLMLLQQVQRVHRLMRETRLVFFDGGGANYSDA